MLCCRYIEFFFNVWHNLGSFNTCLNCSEATLNGMAYCLFGEFISPKSEDSTQLFFIR